ncbi:MAG: hypothetical protein IKP05_04295 [Alphaproteobacteria bacterium]|nr:hypothetical protein [Alphaproteobacteria bacterium]
MKKSTLFLSLFTALMTTSSFAEKDVSSLAGDWGGGSQKTCNAHVIDLLNKDSGAVYNTANALPCIGYSRKEGCQSRKTNNEYSDEYITLMMLAKEVNSHGALFCPVQILARNERKNPAWLKYQDNPNNDISKCTWLCQGGWSGVQCMDPVNTNTRYSDEQRDDTLLQPQNYDSIAAYKPTDNYNTNVPAFFGVSTAGCGHNDSDAEEHMTSLMIVGWLNNGHGAYARLVVARSAMEGWKDNTSWPVLYPVDGNMPTLVCKIGYMPNTQKTDCIPIPAPGSDTAGNDDNGTTIDTSAPVTEASLCEGWKEGFSDELHEFYKGNNATCYVYRCKMPGFGFADDRKVQCVDCTSGTRNGVDNITGKCIKCNSGEIFDTNINGCKKLKKITKDQLLYGNKSANDTDPCWQKFGTEYTQCVLSKTTLKK